MRNARVLLKRERIISAEDLALTPIIRKVYLGGQQALRMIVTSELVKWSTRKVFRSTWRVQLKNTSKIIYPLSAHIVGDVKDERYFSLLDGCDAESGLSIGGARSIMRLEDDMQRLARRLEVIISMDTTAPTSVITQANLLRRTLRVRTGVALSLLLAKVEPGALARAAVPHFQAQAAACVLWLTDQTSTLKMDMTGNSLLQELKL